MTYEERWPFIATYIVASRPRGTLYTGITADLPVRIHQHREARVPGFTQTYGCRMLVWYEPFERMMAAIAREKQIKRWVRAWKVNLIEERNPHWDDLYPGLMGDVVDPSAFERRLAAALTASSAQWAGRGPAFQASAPYIRDPDQSSCSPLGGSSGSLRAPGMTDGGVRD